MNSLIDFFVRKKLLGNLVSLFVVVVGVIALLVVRREVFPNVTFDIITVTTLYPGASPEEVEKLLTSPIEQDLQEVDGIKKMRSVSVEGRSFILLQLDPDQTTEAKAKSDIQDVVDRFVLPDGAEEPVVNSIESKQQPIIEVAIAGDMPEFELRQIAKSLEKEIEEVSGVARVVAKGVRDMEVRVEADPAKLSRYRLALDDLVRALKQKNVSIPGGTIEASEKGDGEKIVRTVGEFTTLDEIKRTVVQANEVGQSTRLSDVANVFYELEKENIINRTNRLSSISLTVLKKEKSDAVDLVKDVKRKLEGIDKRYNPKLKVSYINDFSIFIERRVSILGGNLIVGLVLVLLTLSLFLPFRVSALVAAGIFISFLGTMAIFYLNGYTINLLSLLGLIIVSGMLVDDAIVVSDNIIRHMDEGKDPVTAAIKGTQEMWASVTASVLTTVVAFLPMMFMSGIFGKFVKQIPLGVIIALVISLLQSFFALPQHMASFVHAGALEIKPTGPISKFKLSFQNFWNNTFVPNYVKWVDTFVRRRYWTAFAAGVLFVATLGLAGKFMKFILFPPDGIETFFVRIETERGSSLQKTSEKAKLIEEFVHKIPSIELNDSVTTVGIQQQDPNDPETRRGSQYAQIAVFLTPETDRERLSQEIIDDLRSQIGTPEGIVRITFDRVKPGPPVGKPVSVGLRGKDYDEIKKAADEVKEFARTVEGVTDITDSFSEGKDELQVIVDEAAASSASLSVAAVGQTVRAAYDGIIATTIKELDEEVNVRVSFPKRDRSDSDSLSKIMVPNVRGNLVPLNQISKIVPAEGIATYEHEANRREVRVYGDVNASITSATKANNTIQEFVKTIEAKHPNVSFFFGGEDEDTQESLNSMMRAFGVAFFGIFLILVLTFQQFLQPFLVLLTIPLGIMAVLWAFMLHGLPLSFMGSLGVIALAGVIVNNAIVFIDCVNENRIKGMDRFESIRAAASYRIRPIFLTTTTTVAGLLPTAYGIGGLDKFVVPIAMALGWGLFFGSILSSFLFPATIAILDDFNEWMAKKYRRL
jgi:multidrug efflux pump subunit AcrB